MQLPVVPAKKDPWYADGLQFTCSQCGNCCTGGPGFVWLTREEIVKLAEFLKLTPEQTVEQYCRKVDGRWSLTEVRTPAGTYDCVFLKEIPTSPRRKTTTGDDISVEHTRKGCSIYPVRPLQCRTWPFWPENLSSKKSWDFAARRCHGINTGRTFSLAQVQTIKSARTWPSDPPTSAGKNR
jgi:Fe-S-cluster containining protein